MRCHFLRKCITVYRDSDALFVGAGQFLRRGCYDNVQKSQHMEFSFTYFAKLSMTFFRMLQQCQSRTDRYDKGGNTAMEVIEGQDKAVQYIYTTSGSLKVMLHVPCNYI